MDAVTEGPGHSGRPFQVKSFHLVCICARLSQISGLGPGNCDTGCNPMGISHRNGVSHPHETSQSDVVTGNCS